MHQPLALRDGITRLNQAFLHNATDRSRHGGASLGLYRSHELNRPEYVRFGNRRDTHRRGRWSLLRLGSPNQHADGDHGQPSETIHTSLHCPSLPSQE